jgi:hypothetical protein
MLILSPRNFMAAAATMGLRMLHPAASNFNDVNRRTHIWNDIVNDPLLRWQGAAAPGTGIRFRNRAWAVDDTPKHVPMSFNEIGMLEAGIVHQGIADPSLLDDKGRPAVSRPEGLGTGVSFNIIPDGTDHGVEVQRFLGLPTDQPLQPDSRKFLEAFTILPSTWFANAGPGTETIQVGQGEILGKAYQSAGYTWRVHPGNIPFDPTVLYRIRIRARRTATSDAATQFLWCGVEGIAADGVTQVNVSGANSHASQHYIAAASKDLSATALGQWQEYVGYFQGTAGTGSTESPDINAPGKLHTLCKYFRPLFIVNYSAGPVGNVTQIDYIVIDTPEVIQSFSPPLPVVGCQVRDPLPWDGQYRWYRVRQVRGDKTPGALSAWLKLKPVPLGNAHAMPPVTGIEVAARRFVLPVGTDLWHVTNTG